jgi:hypothetical protein
MQGASKKTGNLLKKPKLTAADSATDEPSNNAPVSEPATLESANDPAITKPDTMRRGGVERGRDHGGV